MLFRNGIVEVVILAEENVGELAGIAAVLEAYLYYTPSMRERQPERIRCGYRSIRDCTEQYSVLAYS
jgi:hypothetical protein